MPSSTWLAAAGRPGARDGSGRRLHARFGRSPHTLHVNGQVKVSGEGVQTPQEHIPVHTCPRVSNLSHCTDGQRNRSGVVPADAVSLGNPYAYAGRSPIKPIDPTGLDKCGEAIDGAVVMAGLTVEGSFSSVGSGGSSDLPHLR